MLTLSQLMVGRLLYITGPIQCLNIGLRIVIRYASSRHQFGPKKEPERCILDYTTHKRKLMPVLGTTLALEFARNALVAMLKGAFEDNEKREKYHAIVSGVKAFTCEYPKRRKMT